MADSPFYTDSRWLQVANNLLSGWGFNFYRVANQLRTDDLLIRGKATELIAQARAAVVDVELAYRREHLPPPTRAKPFPDPEATRQAKRIQAVADALAAVAGAITSAPVPENDRMWERHRDETSTLKQLAELDIALVSIANGLHESTQAADGLALVARLDEIDAAITALRDVLRRRDTVLAFPL